jgi:signal transduction histidine kinase
VWETYRWQIIGGLGVIVLQSASIAALLLHRRHRRLAEQNLRISESHRQTAVLNERNRMARDMHDTLAQGFTGVLVQLEAAKTPLNTGHPLTCRRTLIALLNSLATALVKHGAQFGHFGPKLWSTAN